MSNAVEIDDVSKTFKLYHERGTSLKERLVKAGRSRYDELKALQGISFDVAEGETIGILGRNGSGKSTLLKCICGVLQPSSGEIRVQGKLAGLLELGAGFQPELSGRDNIYLNGSMLGLTRREIDAVFDDIVGFAELESFIDNQVKFYSSGMYVRLGFAVAVNVDPDILVIDEVLAVGDEKFQRKCIARIKEFQEMGRTIIFVSHSADQVRSICDRAVVLQTGEMIGMGTPGDAVRLFRERLLEADGAPPAEEAPPEVEPGQQGERFLLRIREVFTSVSERENPVLESGEPFSVTAVFRVKEPIDSMNFIIEVHGAKGELLLRTDTNELGMPTDAPLGEGRVTFDFPSWPLSDGRYDISVGAQSRLGETTYDWRENVVSVEVVYHGKASGLLNLPLSASLTAGGPIVRKKL
jgi:ABC-2 type transport system ATP-binding protein